MSVRELAVVARVSKGTVSRWIRDIPLTHEQRRVLEMRNPIVNRQHAGARSIASHAREKRRTAQERGRSLAQSGDKLFTAGCMLYWAEGTKGRNTVDITNSDPALLRHFVGFLRRQFAVPNERVRITCNLFADHIRDQCAIEQFWLDALELDRSSLLPSVVNVYSRHSRRRRVGRLPYGTCKLRVSDTQVVQAIYGGIQELGGFERPEWLD